MTAVESTLGVNVAQAAPVAVAPGFLRRLIGRPLGVICLAYLAIVVVIAIVAPIVFPHVSSENAGDLLAVRQGPSAQHLLGTDTLGRDVLERLLVGTRVTLVGVAEALVVVLLLGVPFGLAAGFFGGAIDRVVSWTADLTFSMPAIVIIIVVLAVFPQSMTAAMATFGLLTAPGLMRVVRSATLPVREELYIAAAQVSGLSNRSIIARHVLPRISGAVIVQASLIAAVALIVQTGLAFLGLVVAAPAPSWGGMVADGVTALELHPWLIWPPGVAIALTILALGLLGDVVRDASSEGWAGPVKRLGSRRRAVRAASPSHQPSAGPTHIDPGGRDVVVAVEHLSASLPSPAVRTPVLADVSFDIRRGETVGLVGESGCGKTMTAMAVLGLLPGSGRIDAGRILYGGRDLVATSERELRQVRGKEIALVSQEPMISLDPAFRVGGQLAEYVRRHHGLSRSQARVRARELLHQVRLPDPDAVAQRYPHELSGGMAQRVAIARALAGEPELLIADEPTTALDVTVQAEILSLLRDLQRQRQMAILLVTHDWGVVADICDRAIVMYAGQVVERANLVPIFRRPLHPYTEALLASNPHSAIELGVLPTIPGTVPQPGEWPEGCHFHPRCAYATDACRAGAISLHHAEEHRETRCIHFRELAAS